MMQTSFIYDCTPRFVQLCVLNASRSTGKERDAESGNDYFGARYYASSMGRFMSPDPSRLSIMPNNPQTWNR
jgi:RHS repeat-associated protein